MPEVDRRYEIVILREEARDLAQEIIDALPGLVIPGSPVGVGIMALVIVTRRLIDILPEPEREAARENAAVILALPLPSGTL